MFCPHGICLGFKIMETAEGESMVFEDLYHRFHRPPAVYYDRGCKLHTYALRRDADYFASARFRLDSLHAKNHTGCASTYDPTAFRTLTLPAGPGASAVVNTQAAEQANASLQQIRSPVAFMTFDHFMQQVRWFLARRNMRKQEQLKNG